MKINPIPDEARHALALDLVLQGVEELAWKECGGWLPAVRFINGEWMWLHDFYSGGEHTWREDDE